MYATGSREHGLGQNMASRAGCTRRDYRFDRIDQLVVPNTLRLLEWARAQRHAPRVPHLRLRGRGLQRPRPADVGMCKATRNRKGLREHELLDVLDAAPTERVINKITPSAFTSSPIELILRTYGATDLVFTGVSTNMCVESTLRDASDKRLRLRHGRGRDRGRRAGVPRQRDPRRCSASTASVWSTDDDARAPRGARRGGTAAPSAEGRDRRRRHVHRPDARRRRVGLGGRAQGPEHPDRPVAGDDGRPARALRARRRGARATSSSCCTARRWRRTSSSSATARRPG